jgi:hypothetical protein
MVENYDRRGQTPRRRADYSQLAFEGCDECRVDFDVDTWQLILPCLFFIDDECVLLSTGRHPPTVDRSCSKQK